MVYVMYRDAKNEWRWRLFSANNKIIAVSSEGYVNKADCRHSIDLVKSSTGAAIVEE